MTLMAAIRASDQQRSAQTTSGTLVPIPADLAQHRSWSGRVQKPAKSAKSSRYHGVSFRCGQGVYEAIAWLPGLPRAKDATRKSGEHLQQVAGRCMLECRLM